jgi:hypothetical protein
MTTYIPNKTQEGRILELLRQRGSAGVYSWEITNDLHILQYNARVFGLRHKGFEIKNTKNHFVLTYDPFAKPVQMDLFL